MSTTSLLGVERERLYYTPPLDPSNDGKQDVVIYMISGNPGLIAYYEPFLSTLHTQLQSSPASQSANFYICGYSFAGFETSPAGDEKASKPPVGLRAQIHDTEDHLYSYVVSHRRSHAANGKSLKVILMGHSVGAYILLELIQDHKRKVDSGNEDFDLIGGILLFPTITHIAKSPSGMVASVSITLKSISYQSHPFIYTGSYRLSPADTPEDTICGPSRWCCCQIFVLPRTNGRSLQHYQISHEIPGACSEDNH